MIEKEILTSRRNSLIKKIHSLHQHKNRVKTGLFLVEGIHNVGAAIEANWDVNTILYTPELLTSRYAHDLILGAAKKGIFCQSTSTDIFHYLAKKENPQGILAAVHQRDFALSDFDNFKHITYTIFKKLV